MSYAAVAPSSGGSAASVVIFLLIWAAMVVAAGFIGRHKGRTGLGIVLGLFLGLFGVLIIACVPMTIDEKTRRQIEARAKYAHLENQR